MRRPSLIARFLNAVSRVGPSKQRSRAALSALADPECSPSKLLQVRLHLLASDLVTGRVPVTPDAIALALDLTEADKQSPTIWEVASLDPSARRYPTWINKML